MSRSSYVVEERGASIILPASTSSLWTFTVFPEVAERRLDAFIAQTLGATRAVHDQACEVAVSLVHRPDNTYNPNAMAVAVPTPRGAHPDDRHLGYLYDYHLRQLGMYLLPDLAEHSNGEIQCTALCHSDGLSLALPSRPVLADAIKAFLAARGPKQRIHTTHEPETVESLRCVASFPEPIQPISAIKKATEFHGGATGRYISLGDRETNRHIGSVIDGHLYLADERDREAVLRLLEGGDTPATRPTATNSLPLHPDWPLTRAPNMWTHHASRTLGFRANSPRGPRSGEWLATYNPFQQKLWVEDSRLVGVCLCYAARIGLPVRDVELPRVPWKIDHEMNHQDVNATAEPRTPRASLPVDEGSTLLESVRALVPANIFPPKAVRWIPYPRPALVEDATFRTLERHVQERATLFGDYARATTSTCRLCGELGTLISTALCTDLVCYCHGCLRDAIAGGHTDRSRAAKALALIAKLEFDGEPMLEAQLRHLHINPEAPAPAETIDKLLLLRSLISRRTFPWTRLLEEAGLARTGVRTGRGTLIRARDGHLCLSMWEKGVCDFLHMHQIPHEREPRYPVDPTLNAAGMRRADWLLADGTFVELWGLPNDPAYAERMATKRRLAHKLGINLLELTAADLPHLPAIFAPWLPAGADASRWAWSPLVPPTATPRRSKGDNRGRNETNRATRKERLARCEQAVKAQQQGATRQAIAQALGVSTETVKILLRDGKFYANPATDPDRHQLAKAAIAARRAHQTRAQFRAEHSLTAAKATEAWKDADALTNG